MVAIPLGPLFGSDVLVGTDLDAGLFFVLAAMSVGVIGTLMAGVASGNKYSYIGGLRVAAQLMSYELPMVLAASSVAMAAGTLSLVGIAEAWEPWWLLAQLPGLVVFFVAGLAELHAPAVRRAAGRRRARHGPAHRVRRHAVRDVPALRVRRHRRCSPP